MEISWPYRVRNEVLQ